MRKSKKEGKLLIEYFSLYKLIGNLELII